MWKSVASNALTLLIVGIFLLGGLVLWGKDQYTGPGPLAEAICVRVQPGARMGSVTNDLEEKGAVTSASIMPCVSPLFALGPYPTMSFNKLVIPTNK